MSSPQKSPNYKRYFFARFSHLKKPLVWGPIGVFSLVLLFAWELSVHPEWLTLEDDDDSISNGNTITETLSPEEISIMSDIGNSSVLMEELKNAQKLQINPLASSQKNLLDSSQRETKNTSVRNKNIIKSEEDLVNPLPKINIYEGAQTNNLPSTNQLPKTKLSTNPLLRSMNLLDSTNEEEKKEKPVNALQNAMDEYLGSKSQSQSPSNYQSQTNNINLYPTEIKPRDIKPSPILNIPTSNIPKSQERRNYNPPLAPINVTPPKPYYTDLSRPTNQINNQTNLQGSNYFPQRQPATPNLPPLIPVVPNSFANNRNGVNGVNNWGVPNYYNNQGYPQNQQQYYYGVNPNQVNQNLPQTPSNNPFSRRNNSFYNRGYNQRWNNPF
ncbi:MAG: hypothetical protein F6K40_28765 [Okeania sp. SIO3I5]|uniref:hypothetical protein n=1 Tax=Okeania sp. SIO3I5 TaxID=2607805 RepID=UPI0013BC142D|nr:hypothetical protein [Okeania sp. SIO3I5]NEQ40019.1 hypothetical protein [Okeania sp. SIO3I5]